METSFYIIFEVDSLEDMVFFKFMNLIESLVEKPDSNEVNPVNIRLLFELEYVPGASVNSQQVDDSVCSFVYNSSKNHQYYKASIYTSDCHKDFLTLLYRRIIDNHKSMVIDYYKLPHE